MKYMGSKARIAKYILPIMLEYRKEGQYWVEPFVGGGNMIDKVKGKRIGADSNEYVIEALKLIRDRPDNIPDLITEEDYYNIKNLNYGVDLGIRGIVGFSMSYGAKWFGGYRRDKKGQKGDIFNMKNQTRMTKNSAIKQSPLLKGCLFLCSNYYDLELPEQSLIYCDPPYANTTKYRDDFDHEKFWQWCFDMKKAGHTVFVSEYTAPNEAECLWQKEVNSSLTKNTGAKKGVECLFRV